MFKIEVPGASIEATIETFSKLICSNPETVAPHTLWSIMISEVPSSQLPAISFIDHIDTTELAEMMRTINLDPSLIEANPSGVPEEITLNDHFFTRVLSILLAELGVAHHAFFKIGDVWMSQIVTFGKSRSTGVICWPAGMPFTILDALCLATGLPAPGKQPVLDRVIAAGGYICADLLLMGMEIEHDHAFVSAGEPPNFVRYKEYVSLAHSGYWH